MLETVFHNFHLLFGDHVVFSVGLLLFVGYFAGELAEKIKLPSITGYIITGLILGEGVLGFVPNEMAHRLTSITEIALGLIALTIGGEFSLFKIKNFGIRIFILTLFEALFAFVVIVIRQLRARGEFVDHLYGVVAFDDAVCVIIFSIVFAVIGPMLVSTGLEHGEHSVVLMGFIHAFEEIGFSILLGAISGFLLNMLTIKKYKLNEILILSIAIIFLNTAVAIVLHLSLLISNMVLGAVLINISPKNKRIFKVIEPITPPIFALFFILAGSELDISVFSKGIVLIYGIVYLIARFSGKYLGIISGATLTKANSRIKKYLGFCLFPQAGVAIGLVLLIQTAPIMSGAPPEVKEKLILIVNIILFSIFINELVGPAISKYGIIKGADL